MKIIRYFISWFRCHLGPNQVSFGSFLGTMAGIMPFGIQTIFFIFLFLIFRVSLLFFLTFFLIFKIITPLCLSSLCTNIGLKIILNYPFILYKLNNLPLLSYLNLYNYYILGTLIVGIIFSILSFIIVRILYWALKGSQLAKFCRENRLSKWLASIFYGDKEFKANKVIRGHLVLFLLLIIFMATSLCSLGGGIFLSNLLEKENIITSTGSWNFFKGNVILKDIKLKNKNDSILNANLIDIKINYSKFLYKNVISPMDEIDINDLQVWLANFEKYYFDNIWNKLKDSWIKEELEEWEINLLNKENRDIVEEIKTLLILLKIKELAKEYERLKNIEEYLTHHNIFPPFGEKLACCYFNKLNKIKEISNYCDKNIEYQDNNIYNKMFNIFNNIYLKNLNILYCEYIIKNLDLAIKRKNKDIYIKLCIKDIDKNNNSWLIKKIEDLNIIKNKDDIKKESKFNIKIYLKYSLLDESIEGIEIIKENIPENNKENEKKLDIYLRGNLEEINHINLKENEKNIKIKQLKETFKNIFS